MKNRILVLAILCSLLTLSANAQKLTMGYLFPAGGQVGSSVEIEAGGLNINKAVKVVFNHTGIKGEIIPISQEELQKSKKKRRRLNDQSSPQLADKVKIKITIDDNVPCGLYDLRLQSPKGLSNKLPFEVSSYPNFIERKQSSLAKPNKVEQLPAVLCGQVTPGGIDYFKFAGNKGETIVASVKGRQLVPYIADAVPGWFQPVIKIMDSKGKEVAYCDDYYHHVDPVIMVTLPKSGNYTLMIHDAIYRGRADFNYRIELGVIPFVTGRYPAYGVVGKKVKQHIEGVNLSDTKVSVKVKNEGYNHLSYTNNIGTSNTVQFYALPKGTRLIEYPKEMTELTAMSAIADSLTADAKIKRYKIYAEKRVPLIVELIGRRNNSRIDAVIRLKDRYGNIIKEVDDTEDPIQGLITFHADPILKYTPRINGELTLEVEDRHRGYGKDYHYLLRCHTDMPTFNAFVSPAYITNPSGGTSLFRVDVTGRYKNPAHLEIKGLPKGFTTSSMKLSGKKWDVSITSPKGTEIKRYPIELKLDYPVGKGERKQANVLPVDKMMQAFYYEHRIPASELAIDVTEPSPYRMSLDIDLEKEILVSLDAESFPIKVMVDKNADFNEPIDLMLGRKIRMFTLEPVSILPEETEKIIHIKLNSNFMERLKKRKNQPRWQLYISGTVKGEWVKQGKGRQVQIAKYSEMTPIFLVKTKKN